MAPAMTFQAAATVIILIASLLAFASQRLRPEIIALCVTLALILTGVLSPAEAFSAFGQPVIIIIACVYVLGAALYENGLASVIAERLSRVSNQGPVVLIGVIVLTAGLLSSVLSSMLVVAALMPAVLRIARQARRAPTQLLLPLVAGATMGNLLTLIGTISTLVVSDLLAAGGFGPLRFFSITPFGLISLLLAVLWYALVGRRLLRRETPSEPERPSLDEVEQDYQLDKMLYRLRVRSGSDLIALRLEDSPLSTRFHLNVVAVQPQDGALTPAGSEWVLDHNDILVVEGSRGNVLQAAGLHHLEPKGTMPLDEFNLFEEESLRLAELMVPFRSQLAGKTVAGIRFRDRYALNILAVRRQGQAIRENLSQLALAAGDTLLVQGPLANLRRAARDPNLVLVTHLGPEPGDLVTRNARLTLGVLAVMLVCVISGLLSLAVASLAAAVALILTRCISLERAYQSIDGSIIILIGGMLPLAAALEKTGVAGLFADQLAGLTPVMGSIGTLLLLYLVTHVITQVVPNTVAAALGTPIAISLAAAQGLSPQPFAIAIAIAVTTSYVTPLTNTDNLLVRDAGRYTMRDYLVNGVPLFLLQITAVLLLLLVFGST